MRILILGMLRRRKWLYGLSIPYFFLFSSSPALGTGLMLGTWFASGLNSREILQLPISRKEIWRTRWILAFIPIFLALLAQMSQLGIALASGRKPHASPSWILVIFFFQLGSLGMLSALSGPLADWVVRFIPPPSHTKAYIILGVAGVVAETFLTMQPFRQLHEWSAATMLLLAAGLCVAVISFFHSPRLSPRMVVNLTPASGYPKYSTRYSGQGLTLLVWNQIRGALIGGAMSGLASQLPLLIGAGWMRDGRFILERGTIFSDPVTVGAAILFATPIMMSAVWLFLAPDLLNFRHLRVLPLTTRTLAAMFTLIPVLFWLCFWVFPVTTYWLLAGHLPATLHLEMLSALTGLTCLAGSVGLLLSAKPPVRILPLPIACLCGFGALHLYGAPLTPAAAVLVGILGLIAVAISFVWTERAFHRSGSMYKSILRHPGIARPRWILE